MQIGVQPQYVSRIALARTREGVSLAPSAERADVDKLDERIAVVLLSAGGDEMLELVKINPIAVVRLPVAQL